MAQHLDAFRACSSAAEFLATAEGNHRNAEQAAWELHEYNGSPKGGYYAHLAIEIAESRLTKGAGA